MEIAMVQANSHASEQWCRECASWREDKFFERTIDGTTHRLRDCITCVNIRAGNEMAKFAEMRRMNGKR